MKRPPCARVRTLPPEEIVIACETVNYKELADGLAAIFRDAPGWSVKVLHRSGLDISAVAGIQLIPREPATELLKDAIESSTKLKVTLGDETRERGHPVVARVQKNNGMSLLGDATRVRPLARP